MARMRAAVMLLAAALVVTTAEAQVVELALTNGELPKEQRLVRVKQGETVTLRWTSDRAASLHLHGYDVELKLAAGKPGEMRVTARAAGRFPIEIHAADGKHRIVGYLEVHPR